MKRGVFRLTERAVINRLASYGVIVIAVTLAYSAGLHGPFVFDDLSNIIQNPAVQISSLRLSSLYAAAVSSPSSPLGRPLAMLSFAVNYLVAGGFTNTFDFKIVNLAIHLVNTGLVYWFVLLLLRQADKTVSESANARWVPALVAALWGLHPLNLTAVLYVVQRMTSLSALFVLLGMILFLYGRQRVHERQRHGMTLIVCGWFVGLILGTGAKETAVLMLLYIPLVEYLFLPRTDFQGTSGMQLRAFYAVGIALPLLAMLVWVLIHPNFVEGPYKIRTFDMTQRLLTEPRVLWFYLYLLIMPDITKFSLYHDDFQISSGLFTPWTTFPAILSLLILAAAAILARKKYPVFSFAVLWFLLGHSLESSFLPLEIAHEHRNYLPILGPLFVIVYALAATFSSRKKLFLTLGATMAVALATITFLRSQTWASEESLILSMAQHHPQSARTQSILAELYAVRKRDLVQALQHYALATTLNPDEISYPIRMLTTAANAEFLMRTDQIAPGPGTVDPFHALTATPLPAHIKDRLSRNGLTPTTLTTLNDLASSMERLPAEYHDLYPFAIDWYRMVLKNPNVSRNTYKSTVINLFNIASAMGDHTTALAVAINARRHDATDVSLALMEADARISLNQIEKAEAILVDIQRNGDSLPADTKDDINVLRNRIQRLREDRAKISGAYRNHRYRKKITTP